MSLDTAPKPGRSGSRSIQVIVIIYALFASCWILLSDTLVRTVISDSDGIILAGMLKGWLFVGISSLLLYGLMRRYAGVDAAVELTPAASLKQGWPFALLTIVIVALTGAGMRSAFIEHKDTEIARIQVIADLTSKQINDWLKDKKGDAELLQSSELVLKLYLRWQASGDLQSGEQLQSWLESFSRHQGFNAVMLLDPSGKKLWGSDESPRDFAPILQAAVHSAIVEHEVLRVGPYRGMADNISVDFVVPLKIMKDPAPLIVLNIDPAEWLFPTLQTWPIPDTSGDTVLFRRDGDQVLFLNDIRFQHDAAAKLRLPVATEMLLSAKVLRGEASLNRPVEGVDYRGIPVIGVMRAIPDTDWFLLTKLDYSELYLDSAREILWIGIVGLSVLGIMLIGLFLLRQGQQLSLAQAVQGAQKERLNALQLLAAVADGSKDAIFAKDLDGRYILFNRAAGKFVGKPVEQVLGRDDLALFPVDQAELVMATDRKIIAENRVYSPEDALDTVIGERIFHTIKGPLRDAGGDVIGTFGIARDITESKRVESALMASEQRYRSLFENMLNGYAHCRMLFENGQPSDFIYLDVNLAFETQTGLKDVVGRKVSEVIPGIRESNADVFEYYGRVAISGRPEYFETYVEALRAWYAVSVYSPQREHFVAVFDVITERKQAELALRASEAFKQAIFDSVDAHIAVINGEGRIIAVNLPWRRFAEENGFCSGEPAGHAGVGMNYLEVCRESTGASSEGALDVLEGIQAVLDGSLPCFNFEYPCHSLTQQHWFIMNVMPLNSAGDGAVIAHIDITARILVENALRISDKRFHDIVNVTANWIWEVDAEARYTYVSESVENLLGYKVQDVLGKSPFDFMPLEEAARAKVQFSEISSRCGIFRDLDNINRHMDGSLRSMQTNGMPILDEGGKLLGYRGLTRDITEKKLAEEQLMLSEERLQLALDASSDGLWDWDVGRDLVFFTPQYYHLTGSRPGPVTPNFEFFKRTIYPDDLPLMQETLEAHLQGKTGEWEHDYRLMTVAGEIKWIRGKGRVVKRDIEGMPLRMVGTLTDISLRKAAEAEKQRQAQELAERNAELERFNNAMVGRELDMIALKRQVNELASQLGRKPPYPLTFLNAADVSLLRDEQP